MSSESLWVFTGEQCSIPAGVFHSRTSAEAWIDRHHLSGILTPFPADNGAYDVAIQSGSFTPANSSEQSATFIQRFGAERLDHSAYKFGVSAENIDVTSYPLGEYFIEICHLGRDQNTGKCNAGVDVVNRAGELVASSGRINSEAITHDLLATLLPEKYSSVELSGIIEAAWRSRLVI